MKKEPKEFDLLKQYGREIKKFERIDFKEEKRLSKAIQKGDLKSRDKLVTSNLKLVPYIASIYKDRGISFEDLVCEGNRGLVTAADKFDYRIGARFSTFAYWQIKEAITSTLKNENKWTEIKEPNFKFEIMTSGVENLHGGDKEVNDIPIDKVVKLSIQKFSDDENEKIEIELIEDLFKDVLIYLEELSPRESAIIKHYFGIEDHDELNVTELSKMYGISNMRVSTIIDDSIRKIRCKYLEKTEF
jgi:RNA polymerase primary sigma factor